MGLASLNVACNQSSDTNASQRPPLPTDSFMASPAGPNCYPDVNHCASYPSGGVTKDNPTKQK
jgi:hypothetical protein